MIRDNEERHGSADRKFIVLDIVRDVPPKVDLISVGTACFTSRLSLRSRHFEILRRANHAIC